MKDYSTFEISEEILEKFKIAVMLNKELEDEVIEQLMADYVQRSFAKVAGSLKHNGLSGKHDHIHSDVDYAKAKRKIPRWAMKPNQMNHRIIRAYFQLSDEYSEVTLENLTKRCSNAAMFSDTYCMNFSTNFNQMKTDAGNSNGKVFIVEREYVHLWKEIKAVLFEYESYFRE